MSHHITKCTLNNFFLKKLRWLSISFSLHITDCAVKQHFGNMVHIAKFGSVFTEHNVEDWVMDRKFC